MHLSATTFAVLTISLCPIAVCEESILFDDVKAFVSKRVDEFHLIPAERKESLREISAYLRQCRDSGATARFVFVCTHNSRRSHMSQLWATVAAAHYNLKPVETYSGGTECTAFNPRAVAAMQRAGFRIEARESDTNPRYSVLFARNAEPQLCFSKVYSDAHNPRQDFCAVMTCSSADKSCPNVTGAKVRIAIPYDDPRIADNTSEEQARYDERCAQISREILFAFSQSL